MGTIIESTCRVDGEVKGEKNSEPGLAHNSEHSVNVNLHQNYYSQDMHILHYITINLIVFELAGHFFFAVLRTKSGSFHVISKYSTPGTLYCCEPAVNPAGAVLFSFPSPWDFTGVGKEEWDF